MTELESAGNSLQAEGTSVPAAKLEFAMRPTRHACLQPGRKPTS